MNLSLSLYINKKSEIVDYEKTEVLLNHKPFKYEGKETIFNGIDLTEDKINADISYKANPSPQLSSFGLSVPKVQKSVEVVLSKYELADFDYSIPANKNIGEIFLPTIDIKTQTQDVLAINTVAEYSKPAVAIDTVDDTVPSVIKSISVPDLPLVKISNYQQAVLKPMRRVGSVCFEKNVQSVDCDVTRVPVIRNGKYPQVKTDGDDIVVLIMKPRIDYSLPMKKIDVELQTVIQNFPSTSVNTDFSIPKITLDTVEYRLPKATMPATKSLVRIEIEQLNCDVPAIKNLNEIIATLPSTEAEIQLSSVGYVFKSNFNVDCPTLPEISIEKFNCTIPSAEGRVEYPSPTTKANVVATHDIPASIIDAGFVKPTINIPIKAELCKLSMPKITPAVFNIPAIRTVNEASTTAIPTMSEMLRLGLKEEQVEEQMPSILALKLDDISFFPEKLAEITPVDFSDNLFVRKDFMAIWNNI